jgi:hypothetical protein
MLSAMTPESLSVMARNAHKADVTDRVKRRAKSIRQLPDCQSTDKRPNEDRPLSVDANIHGADSLPHYFINLKRSKCKILARTAFL